MLQQNNIHKIANEIFRYASSMKLFHVTDKSNLKSIEQNGYKISPGVEGFSAVYFHDNLKDAKNWIGLRSKDKVITVAVAKIKKILPKTKVFDIIEKIGNLIDIFAKANQEDTEILLQYPKYRNSKKLITFIQENSNLSRHDLMTKVLLKLGYDTVVSVHGVAILDPTNISFIKVL